MTLAVQSEALDTLFVDDVSSFIDQVRRIAVSLPPDNPRIVFAGSLSEARRHLDESRFGRVISDLVFTMRMAMA